MAPGRRTMPEVPDRRLTARPMRTCTKTTHRPRRSACLYKQAIRAQRPHMRISSCPPKGALNVVSRRNSRSVWGILTSTHRTWFQPTTVPYNLLFYIYNILLYYYFFKYFIDFIILWHYACRNLWNTTTTYNLNNDTAVSVILLYRALFTRFHQYLNYPVFQTPNYTKHFW